MASRRTVIYRLSWAVIILLAAFLRTAPIRSGLPYINYIDEGHVLHQAIHLLNNRNFDTKWYYYPSLPAYLTAGALIAYGPVYRSLHGHGFRKDLPKEQDVHTNAGDLYDLISPPELIVAGRLVAALLSILTVALVGVTATSLEGKWTGLLAMLIAAACPSLVMRAPIVIVDTFAAFFALLAIYFSTRLWCRVDVNDSWRKLTATLTGLAAGLAFASKYTVVTVFIAVLAVICTLQLKRSSRVLLSFFAGIGLLIGMGLAAPATILSLGEVWHDLGTMSDFYNRINSSPGYFGQAVSAFELHWSLVIAGTIGFVLMLRRKSLRPIAVSWILFAVLLLAFFAGKSFQPFRNLLPLVPLVCIAAAFAVISLIRWTHRGSLRLAGYSAAFVAACWIVGSLLFSSLQYVQYQTMLRDTRVSAIDWLREHTRKDDRVIAVAELGVLPSEWTRVDAHIQIVPWLRALDLLQPNAFDYLVCSEFDLRSAARMGNVAYEAMWKRRISSLIDRAEFGRVPTPLVPYFWRTNDEKIVILAAADPR